MIKNIKKPPSAATLPCKYRGAGIECPVPDYWSSRCESCGWNPKIESERKEHMDDGSSRNEHL